MVTVLLGVPSLWLFGRKKKRREGLKGIKVFLYPLLRSCEETTHFKRISASVIPASNSLNSVYNISTRDDLAKDDVLAIEPRSDSCGDEELAAVGVRAGISHGEEVLLVMLFLLYIYGFKGTHSELIQVQRLRLLNIRACATYLQ